MTEPPDAMRALAAVHALVAVVLVAMGVVSEAAAVVVVVVVVVAAVVVAMWIAAVDGMRKRTTEPRWKYVSWGTTWWSW